MERVTRRSLVGAVGVGLASAGCLSDAGGPATDETTTDSPTTDSATEKTTRGTADATTDPAADATATEERTTGDWIARASNSPDPDHEITVEHDLAESRRLRVTVVREETGETVFETTDEFSRGEHTLYNLRKADPEGVEEFRVCAELLPADTSATTATGTTSPRRDCVTLATNECYGSAYVEPQEDGSVQIIYAIC
ncbi:hypothetical protein [Halorussus salinus]|uniref:hypothetical protein n=1 Tax=Halorussus salinus TaxID=1364935 RepID=UPI00138F9312|nr:hypothetical protein [Halorussus salinus]